MKWYDIKAVSATNGGTPTAVDVAITQEIGYWGITAKQFIDDMAAYKGVPVNMTVHSPGGSVFDALAMFNYLRNSHGAAVTTHVVGVAASAASFLLFAGDTRKISAQAFVMVHDIQSVVCGTPGEMQDAVDAMNKIKASLVGMYAQHTGKDQATVEAWMAKDTWFTAAEALEAGLVTEVVDSAPVTATFDFARLEASVPEALREKVKACLGTTAPAAPVATTPVAPVATTPAAPVATTTTTPTAPVAQPGFIAGVIAACEANGIGEDGRKAILVSNKLPEDAVKAQTFVAFAADVWALCVAVGATEKFGNVIDACDSISAARKHLSEVLANATPEVDAYRNTKPNGVDATASVANAVERYNARK